VSERVKPCLRCDGLVPFEDSHCPWCGARIGASAPAPPSGEEVGVPSSSVPFLAEAAVVGAGAALAVGTIVALGAGF
jgi:hypothetical protein